MSDTNPLPAAQLLKLADAMANAIGSHIICDAGLEGPHMERTWEAYRAARAASPVTLEEFLIVQEEDAQWCRTTVEWIEAVEMTHKHALVLIDARDNARRLAGEGGE